MRAKKPSKKWNEISTDIRTSVLFTIQCDAQSAEACTCGHTSCKDMAQGYRAAIAELSGNGRRDFTPKMLRGKERVR